MIVSCPACNIHYRQTPPPVEAVLAQCSACDESFEIDPARAPYRLVPVAPAFGFETRSQVSIDVPPPPVEADPFDLESAGPPAAEAADAAASEATEASAGKSRVSMYGVALGLLLAGVSAATGYYLSLLGITDMVTGTASGAGVGIVLALAVIRWTMRPR